MDIQEKWLVKKANKIISGHDNTIINIDKFFKAFAISNYYINYYNNNIRKNIKNIKLQKSLISKTELYSLTREIIGKIDPLYIEEFDKFVNDNKILFTIPRCVQKFAKSTVNFPELRRFSSRYCHNYKQKKDNDRIILSRTYTYEDVWTLIHEFIHHLTIDLSINSAAYQEFLPIYYELFAIDYMIKEKNINPDDVNYSHRASSNLPKCKFYQKMIVPAMSYIYGNIDYDNFLKINKIYNPQSNQNMSYDDYIYSLKYFIYVIENAKKGRINLSTTHLMGTLQAFYARMNYSVNEVNELLKSIYTNEYTEESISLFDDIKSNATTNPDTFETINEYIDKYSSNETKGLGGSI